jgi:hypothetical protein
MICGSRIVESKLGSGSIIEEYDSVFKSRFAIDELSVCSKELDGLSDCSTGFLRCLYPRVFVG